MNLAEPRMSLLTEKQRIAPRTSLNEVHNHHRRKVFHEGDLHLGGRICLPLYQDFYLYRLYWYITLQLL